MSIRNLDKLMAPRSIVAIGASVRPGSIGAAVTRNLLSGGFQGDIHLVNLKGGEIDGYSVMNASIGVHTLDGKWDLTFWGNNLTDEYYWLSVTQNANTVIRFPGKTRTYGASLTYRF